MPDAILVNDGIVQVPVHRNCDAAAVFGPTPDGEVFIVDSALGVCAGQLWNGEAATDPDVEPAPAPPSRPSLVAALLAGLVAAGKLTEPEAATAKAAAEAALAGD